MKAKLNFFKIIWTVNGIILLVILLMISTFYIFDKVSKIFDKPAGVEVLSESDEKTGNDVNGESVGDIIKPYGISDNIIILKVLSPAVIDPGFNSSVGFSGSYYSGGGTNGGLVNLRFLNMDTGQVRELLKQNLYIPHYQIAGISSKNDKDLMKSIYFVIEEDTNDNDRLDMDDHWSFYVSDPDGDNLAKIFGDLKAYTLLDEKLVYLTFVDDKFIIYNFLEDKIIFE